MLNSNRRLWQFTAPEMLLMRRRTIEKNRLTGLNATTNGKENKHKEGKEIDGSDADLLKERTITPALQAEIIQEFQSGSTTLRSSELSLIL